MGGRWMEEGITEFLKLLIDLAYLRNYMETMAMAALGLTSKLGTREVFSHKESVDFIFKDLHLVSQDLGQSGHAAVNPSEPDTPYTWSEPVCPLGNYQYPPLSKINIPY